MNISSSIETSIHEHDCNVHHGNEKDPQQDYSPTNNQKDGMFIANVDCTTYDMDWNGEKNHLKVPTWSVKFETQSLSQEFRGKFGWLHNIQFTYTFVHYARSHNCNISSLKIKLGC